VVRQRLDGRVSVKKILDRRMDGYLLSAEIYNCDLNPPDGQCLFVPHQ